MKDPIVEEVRRHREEHTKKFHGELSEICADLRRVQEISGREVVRLEPRRIVTMLRSNRRVKACG
jgi:hypothetical protein